MPRLVIVEPQMEGVPEAYELREKELSIGRDQDNTITLDREAMSSHHVKLKWKDGDYEFQDMDSTNGTYYNGEKVKEGMLRNGDVFQVADVVFAYESAVDPNDMDKLVEAEEKLRKEKAWKIRKNMEAKKTSSENKIELAPIEPAIASPPQEPVIAAKESGGLPLFTGVILFIVAFAFGCACFYMMLILL